eukprot:1938-Eustigmatos_ZCMA.PRE.1
MAGASARSTFRGVHKVKNGSTDKWIVKISVGGVKKFVGCFGDEMEALLRAEGHIYVARPPNSPEFAPTEPMFHLIEQSLK